MFDIVLRRPCVSMMNADANIGPVPTVASELKQVNKTDTVQKTLMTMMMIGYSVLSMSEKLMLSWRLCC